MARPYMARSKAPTPSGPPRLEYLQIENYRALRHIELADLTPLTVLLGPNGSGKSTVFDVFNFLSECFTLGLRNAWDKRGRFRELRTRGSDGRLRFELRYRETPDSQPATYHLEIDEEPSGPVVVKESLKWRRVAAGGGAPYKIRGGTHEALARILRQAGYFTTGLRKIEAARTIAAHMVPARNTSRSFCALRDALRDLEG